MPCQIVKMKIDHSNEFTLWAHENHGASSEGYRPSLFALVDAASLAFPVSAHRLNDLPCSLEQGINLYADLIGASVAETGPRLWEISDADLDDWIRVASETSAISILCGSLTLHDLAQHLQSLREVVLPDGSLALFRFQDVHVATHLWPLLSPGQGNQILAGLDWWAVPDVCGDWFVLNQAKGFSRFGVLKFERKLYEQLNEQLLVYTVAGQVREVDSALLNGLTDCQSRTLLRSRLQSARDMGLKAPSDQALYVVLSLQLPVGFEHESPFVEALDRSRKGLQTFGDALDQVSADQWRQWNGIF